MGFLRPRHGLTHTALALSGLGIIILACGSQEGGLPGPSDAGSHSQGGRVEEIPSEGGSGSSDSLPNEGGRAGAEVTAGGAGGTAGVVGAAGAPEAGAPVTNTTAGAMNQGSGGAEPTGSAGEGGTVTAPEGGAGGIASSCVYFSEGTAAPVEEPAPEASGGEGGGGAGPQPTITVLKNAFVGTYLADGAGKALYVYARDLAGDCEYPPITNCFDDCAVAWPIFDAVPRLVGPELDDKLFGRIERMDKQTDGSFKLNYQTTYRGWPLYYYKSDLAAADVKGHGKGSIWHLAEVVLPNLIIIRSGSGETDKKTLADEFGRTLYVHAGDTVGTDASQPESACTGSCLDEFHPFMLRYVSPVSYIEPSTVGVFVREDGSAQLTYKGAPLYTSQRDLRSGDMKGLEVEGFTWAAP